MSWTAGEDRYMAEYRGESRYDPLPPLDATEPVACEECGEDALDVDERLCDTCLANAIGRSLFGDEAAA